MARFVENVFKPFILDTQSNSMMTYKNCRERRKAARAFARQHGEGEVIRVSGKLEPAKPPVVSPTVAPVVNALRYRHVPARKAKAVKAG